MAEDALVEALQQDAIQLVRGLDAIGLSPRFAALYFYSDAREWRLLLAIPALDALASKQEAVAYRKVIDAHSVLNLSALRVSHLKLVPLNYPLRKAIGSVATTGPDAVGRFHIIDCVFDGMFVKEMIVLRGAKDA